MSLEGLRAWIGEVERKLAKRTRVFLVLVVVAIGIAGAAVYLAIDARESSVTESDVQALQQQLETRIDALGAAPATPPAATEAVPEQAPEPAPKTAPEAKPETKPDAGDKGAREKPSGATAGGVSAAKLQELVEQAKERSDENK